MEVPQEFRTDRFTKVALIVTIAVISIFAGGIVGYAVSYSTMTGRIDALQSQLQSQLQGELTSILYQNVTYFTTDGVSLSALYKQVQESVVIIMGQVVQYDMFRRAIYSTVQGSGFVYNSSGQLVVVTNYHVVEGASDITVTFTDGNAYAASVLGKDPYEDLAVLSTSAPASELKPLAVTSSSTLEVGDPVIAVGNPYGLAGSMTTGIVSALGRTISETDTGGYPIAAAIQTSAPINPGNSGGPLLNYAGEVVGITTAIVSDSTGVGFAIPSNAILREVGSLIATGGYSQHPSLGASGTDMSYDIAKAMGSNVTYGWLVMTVSSSQSGLQGGTSRASIAGATVTIGGDIIIAIDGTRIRGIDDLSTYLEENTLPGATVDVTVVRSNQVMTIAVRLGTRAIANTG